MRYKMEPAPKRIKRPVWLWKLLKFITLSINLSLFIWQFSFIFRDYLQARTTVTTEKGTDLQQNQYRARLKWKIWNMMVLTALVMLIQMLSYSLVMSYCNSEQKVYDSLPFPAFTICAPRTDFADNCRITIIFLYSCACSTFLDKLPYIVSQQLL